MLKFLFVAFFLGSCTHDGYKLTEYEFDHTLGKLITDADSVEIYERTTLHDIPTIELLLDRVSLVKKVSCSSKCGTFQDTEHFEWLEKHGKLNGQCDTDYVGLIKFVSGKQTETIYVGKSGYCFRYLNKSYAPLSLKNFLSLE